MRLQRIQLNVYIEQRQRYKEKNRFRFRFKKEPSPSSLFRLFIGGCCRVTLVVAFGFLVQILESGRDLRMVLRHSTDAG